MDATPHFLSRFINLAKSISTAYQSVVQYYARLGSCNYPELGVPPSALKYMYNVILLLGIVAIVHQCCTLIKLWGRAAFVNMT